MSGARARLVVAAMTSGSLIFLLIGGAIAAADYRAFGGAQSFVFVVAILLFSLIGALVASRRPENPIGWILAGAGFAVALSGASDVYARYTLALNPGALPAGEAAAWISNMTGSVFFFLALTFTLQLFPTGRPLNDRWILLRKATMVSMVGLLLGLAFAPGPLEDLPIDENPLGLAGALGQVADALEGFGWLAAMGCLFLSVVSVGLRWRRSSGDERQQLKWLGVAGVVLLIFMTVATITDQWDLLAFPLVAIPLAVGIAVLKYRLYDIDVVINKTIVFGSLAAFITAVYVAIVVGIGTLLGSQDEPNLALSIAATAIVAIAFSPVKERTQHIANRLVYGHRLSPYEVLTDLSRMVAAAPTPHEVLSAVASAAAAAGDSPGASVTLLLRDGTEIEESFPTETTERDEIANESATFEVTHEDEALGRVIVDRRAADPLTAHDRSLLEDLSSQAGLALHNARLALELQARLEEIERQADELQSSRARIVSAADDSRRRLERDITNGPKERLETIQKELESTARLMNADASGAATSLESLTVDANATLDSLRELARGIYPPLLADKGIGTALESHVRKHDLDVVIQVDDRAREARFDPSVETTAYFCCVEALAGAAAGACVKLASNRNGLALELSGVNLEDSTRLSILDRVQALGGTFEATTDGAAELLRIDLSAPILEPV